jgi:hypothetical protein
MDIFYRPLPRYIHMQVGNRLFVLHSRKCICTSNLDIQPHAH